jgi:hypothetical protein
LSFVVYSSTEMALVTDTVAAKARAATLETKPMLTIMHSATIGLVVAFGVTAYKSCVTRVVESWREAERRARGEEVYHIHT